MLISFNTVLLANNEPYDLVYVAYPDRDKQGMSTPEFVYIPQGEEAYNIVGGADLMVTTANNGGKHTLVDCDNSCSVMDPFISYDAKTVYYSKMTGLANDEGKNRASLGLLYKIHLNKYTEDANGKRTYTPIQLTFNDGFDSYLYKRNGEQGISQGSHRYIRDMSPVPLADGRLLFTSNRASLIAFNPDVDEVNNGSIQELYVMDDHEGGFGKKELANIKKLDAGTLHLAQHPMQLKDGRILFSTWQDAGTRIEYANTCLFTIHPDGTNLQQFTECHHRNKMLDHFVTQLANQDVVVGVYYPSFDWGFGVLKRIPVLLNQPIKHLSGAIKQLNTYNNRAVSRRSFDRKGSTVITPHTTGGDEPAPNDSGKYSMPSVAPDGDMLVAYSKGKVNWFNFYCVQERYGCEKLRSGIYLIPNATNTIIKDPKDLIKIVDEEGVNEIWPRAVVPYKKLMGVDKPAIIPNDRSNTDNAAAILGSSSMINRESAPQRGHKFADVGSREFLSGNCVVQGCDAYSYTDDEIWGVRIMTTPPKPYTSAISKFSNAERHAEVLPLMLDKRINRIASRFGSVHGERWEVLGEFPLAHTNETDLQGNRDTSWKAKVPADTPLFLQAIDKRGMALNIELTWRGLKSGEMRADCGGCHAHSIDKLDYATTQSGKNAPIQNVKGVPDNHPNIQNSIYDLTKGSIPLVDSNGVTTWADQSSLGVEFTRDIEPIIKNNCASCHTPDTNSPNLSISGVALWQQLAKSGCNGLWLTKYAHAAAGTSSCKAGGKLQRSPFIRAQFARDSLLTWIAYGERLDGKTNETQEDDIDYPDNHPVIELTEKEKRAIARWIDLGNPMDFPNSNTGFEYTADYMLPVITKVYPANIPDKYQGHYHIGFNDIHSGLNWETLTVDYYPIETPSQLTQLTIDQSEKVDSLDVLHIDFNQIDIEQGSQFVLSVTIEDNFGNTNIFTERLIK